MPLTQATLKNGETNINKRKASSSPPPPETAPKRRRRRSEEKEEEEAAGFKDSTTEEQYSIVDRQFYPPEMTNERCAQYKANKLERPIESLQKAQLETKDERDGIDVNHAVVHWFKCDLRTSDNRSLHLASKLAKAHGVPLICLHIISPQDYKAHMTSPVRVDFVLRTLEVLKADLAKLDIPLYVETAEKRKGIPDRILDLCEEWGASHLFCNIEYEVDELRREALMTRKGRERGIAVTAVHDTCVVAPGELSSGSGNQYAVYSPWYRAWVAYIHRHPHQLQLFDPPSPNPQASRPDFAAIFATPIPEAPENKRLTEEEKKRFRSMWPPGEHEAHGRLDKFLKEKAEAYKETRNFPAMNSTAMLSVHFASGTLSARTAVARARDANSTNALDGGHAGIKGWISEIAWRDFYKHVLVHWPHVCMNKPFKPEYTNIRWEYDEALFRKWCRGQTGYPFIDAAMRQLNHMGYMHNRARMGVASFLAKDLLLDWRRGERYFMEHLIDGDFASNNGGWGFSASTGVDPQPYFRIFNPHLQGEKFDPDGVYIRKWVPELGGVKGKAIHDPYERGAEREARKNGYPKSCVQHKASRERALARYKEGLGRDTA
ncbi:MAG: hypothetical protein L6R40_000523 [Gallowayella cf. fulva]|nr:MAG: hypothetical protein L6R40_000523 [Xanthomendoza cf. fulva]